jgi:hypothetical protein
MTMSDSEVKLSDLTRPPGAKFDALGDRIAGTIVSVKREQQTDFDTGELKFWSNGDPALQTVIVVRQDDGTEATLFAKAGTYQVDSGEGTSMENAIAKAAAEAGADAIRSGATLEVVHSGLGKKTNPKFAAPKLYAARYVPAVEAVPVSGLFTNDK